MKQKNKFSELQPEEMKWFCDPEVLGFATTAELTPADETIGQARALSALELGVNIDKPGYNIYISGLSGTGKATTVENMLRAIGNGKAKLFDFVYVNNFEAADCPALLTFPAGKAKEFKKEIRSLIVYISERIPVHMQAESYRKKRDVIIAKYKATEWEMFESFKTKLTGDGFTLSEPDEKDNSVPQILTVINKKAVTIDEVMEAAAKGEIGPKAHKSLLTRYENHRQKLITIFHKAMKLNQKMHLELEELEKAEVNLVLDAVMQDLFEKFKDAKIQKYLRGIQDSLLSNLWIFKRDAEEEEAAQVEALETYLRGFEVNIILDNSNTKLRPVIVEISPSGNNLFGSIERTGDGSGKWTADFTKIKAGSLLKANGGYIVIRAVHLFEEQGVWQTLKRVLTYNKLEIQENFSSHYLPPASLKPEPIEITTKVILIGGAYWYSFLASNEDDFKKIFKVKVDFDSVVTKSDDIVKEYARVLKRLVNEEKLLELEAGAVASLMEHAARYAEHKERLTTRFSFLADIAREADYWARKGKSKTITAEYVKYAYNKSKERHSLGDEKLTEAIIDNQILIQTSGKQVGCINGLLYFEDESFGFGKPARITCSVSIGDGVIVNVERESGLSGHIFDKATLVITGYIGELFGRNIPLSFNASFVFEQSYGGIDGDSATAAEIFILLSSLSEVPLKQSLAVTGSVNQRGEMQPIGGINEKIEGFFEICVKRGLTGEHGVVIPRQNIVHLMLSDKIIDAVREGLFHIYPVRTVAEGIEIFTGIPAGIKNKSGDFPDDSVFGKVEASLLKMYKIANNETEINKPNKNKK